MESIRMDPEYLEKSKRIYRQPSFFDIEAGRRSWNPRRLKF